MLSRDPAEAGRSATPLELLYDLCFVVAVARAGAGLHHAVAEGHSAEGLLGFGLVFFAVWWAWMGFAWFASAFDTDDPLYRLKVLVQMLGVLVLAAGVPRAFQPMDFSLITYGYAIMRLGLVAQWVRAGRSDTSVRKTAYRYALGITLLQVGWIALLALPAEQWVYGWLVLAPLELLVPWWAESAGATCWHPHHIAERYGLFTIIVIGESVLASVSAVQTAVDRGNLSGELVLAMIGAPVILFAMWWLYFAEPAHRLLTSKSAAFIWGYGHYFIFGAAAAVGAGLSVVVDYSTGRAHVSGFGAYQAVAIPVAVYVVSLGLIHLRHGWSGRLQLVAGLAGSVLILLAPLTAFAVPLIALILGLLTAISVLSHRAGQ